MGKLNFEINFRDETVNEVLLDIPYGKRYLSDLDAVKAQNAQKGETCWYYVMNYLRPRFGKFFPEDLMERKVEKIISNTRKKLEQQDTFKKLGSTIQIYFNTQITKQNVHKPIEIFSSVKDVDFSMELKLCNDFLRQNEFDYFDDYVDKQFHQTRISIYQEAIAALGFKPDEVLKSHIENYYSDLVDTPPLSMLDKIYADLFQTIVSDIYKLKETSWHPDDPIEDLIEALREDGCLYVGGQYGSAYCNEIVATKDPKFGKRPVFELIEDSGSLNQTKATHAILIVGAKSTRQGNYVYYLDPNDANTPDNSGKLYKISYERLIAGITDTHSMRIKRKGAYSRNRKYGSHADLENIEAADAKYGKHRKE